MCFNTEGKYMFLSKFPRSFIRLTNSSKSAEGSNRPITTCIFLLPSSVQSFRSSNVFVTIKSIPKKGQLGSIDAFSKVATAREKRKPHVGNLSK
ncbi:hypothetical protein [Bufonid herpesvirus 1]|uniref:hypothetical protein n=1 Tax=Bufonid herpesvirus 1 TaxID=2282206 RepID=UPI000EB67CF8|nr:hypothetical protein [Bufonid herpesvirus 1]AXF48612.1 hypothetical protein [Bufonid herpesvirus 1]